MQRSHGKEIITESPLVWCWISSLPSCNSLLSWESVKPSVSALPLLFWAWDPAAQSLRCLSFGLFSSLLWKQLGTMLIVVLWALSMGPGAGRAVREAVQRSKAEARLAASCYCSGLGMLSWLGCIPSGSVSVLWSSLKWRVQLELKVTLVSALELQVLYSGSQRTSPGEAFFPATDFSETWFRSSCDLFYTVLIVASLQQVIKRQGIVQQPLNAPSKSNFSLLSFCSNCAFLAKSGNKSV